MLVPIMEQRSFISGIELARRYWHDVVAPIIDDLAPGVGRAAARIGAGSDVLGFDTERSTDHGWGPRVVVLFEDGFDLARERRIALLKAIDARIPDVFLGYATRFAASEGGPSRHQVMLTTVGEWCTLALGFDPRRTITDEDWLATPSQLLLEATAGAVFEDGPGDFTRARERLRWYPDDVWLYLLACQWRRIDQEEPFVGRTGEVGDDSRLGRDHGAPGARHHAAVLPHRAAIRAVCEVARHGVRAARLRANAGADAARSARGDGLAGARGRARACVRAAGQHVQRARDNGAGKNQKCVTSMTGHSACSGRDGSSRRVWRRRHFGVSAMRAASINSRTTQTC